MQEIEDKTGLIRRFEQFRVIWMPSAALLRISAP